MSTTTRRWTRAITILAAAGAALAVTLGSAIPAAAGPYGADGVTRNPVNIVTAGARTQAITIPTGGNWGDAVRNQDPNGSAAQTWQFSFVRYVPVPYSFIPAGHPDETVHETLQMPVWKIINQQNGNRTCLDAYSANPGVGSVVDFYGCDPNFQDQPNQLWIVAGPSQLWSTGDYSYRTSRALTGDQLFTNANGSAVALFSYHTFLASGNDLSKALVVSGAEQVNGINSALSLQPQLDWPRTNKLWFLKDVNSAPAPSSPTPTTTPTTPTTPACHGWACLVLF